MLTNLLENRGKEFSNLLKLGDYLARSLRENVELFNVEKGRVTYLTESGKVIIGDFTLKPNLKLTNIEVEDSEILENQGVFDKIADKRVQSLLYNLLENEYSEAEDSFDQILDLFESKLSFQRIKDRLREKTERFGPQNKIIESEEFMKVVELKDKLVKFLSENENVKNIPEIHNAMKLALVVSRSFDLPKLTIDEIKESKTYTAHKAKSNSIYEHLCRQELIAKELLEAKKNFDTTWASNEKISNLASQIYEKDISIIETSVAEVVSEIPYFALATKGQISKLVKNCLSMGEVKISEKDVSKFTRKIYEIKKPVKTHIIKLLNDKYGINVANLSEIPTFGNLIKTETVIFTALSKLAPKKSILKECLLNLADSLKVKNGTESIDVVTFLHEVFAEAGLEDTLNETSLMSYLDFNQVADDLGKIGSILKLIKPLVTGETGGEMGPEGMNAPEGPMGDLGEEPGMEGEEGLEGLDGLGGEEEGLEGLEGLDGLGGAEGGPEGIETPGMEDEALEGEEGLEDDGDLEVDPMATEDPQGIADEIQGEEGMEGEEGMGEEPEEPVEHIDADDLTSLVADIEDLLGSIKGELGVEDEFGEEDGELGADDFDGAGEDVGMEDEDPEGSDEGFGSETKENDEGEEEEEEVNPQKGKFKK